LSEGRDDTGKHMDDTGEHKDDASEQSTPQTGAENPSTPLLDAGNRKQMVEGNGKQSTSRAELVEPVIPMLGNAGTVWVRLAPSQVMRTVAVALLTAAVVLGGLFLLWQVHTFIGQFVIALFLAAVLNPIVNWLQRRHRMVKRSIAIVLSYLGVVVALLLIAGIFVPLIIQEIRDLIDFFVGVSVAGGAEVYVRGLADQFGLGWVADRLSTQLADLPSQLGALAKSLLLSAGGIAIGAASAVASIVTILTLTFFMLLGSERLVNGAVGLAPEPHRPLVRNILRQSGGAVFGYVSGNLAISFIAGVTTFILLVILGMPYAAALALLVAVLDLIPLVGATLGAAVVIVVALFVDPWKALVLLGFFLVYQQLEGSILQPMVYSRAVHLDGLTIFVAVLVGALLLGIPGALLAIPVAEIIRVIVTDVLAYRRMRREESESEISSPAPLPPA